MISCTKQQNDILDFLNYTDYITMGFSLSLFANWDNICLPYYHKYIKFTQISLKFIFKTGSNAKSEFKFLNDVSMIKA